MNRSLRSETGITTGELLVFFAVLSSVLGAAWPSVAESVQAFALRGEARRIYSDLQKMRTTAVMENRRQTFQRREDGTYVICQDEVSPLGACDVGDAVSATETITRSGVTITFAQADNGPGRFSFLPNGTATTTFTVTVTNAEGHRSTVTVAPAGQVRVES